MLQVNAAELARLNARLATVAEKVGKRALRTAARKGMTLVRDEARANAPKDTGALKAHFALTTRLKGGTVFVRVGVRGGAVKNPTTPYYFRMIELGTQHIPARPFMRPALEGNAEAVFQIITAELSKALDRAL